jgi:hypothetical protein
MRQHDGATMGTNDPVDNQTTGDAKMSANCYRLANFLKFAMIDNYNEGCDPDSTFSTICEVTFTGKTKDEVIEKAASFFGCQPDDIERNACDEPGRIDFQVMECDDGTTANKNDMAAWKNGQRRLWDVTYTAYLEKVSIVKA